LEAVALTLSNFLASFSLTFKRNCITTTIWIMDSPTQGLSFVQILD
jgi:hypothetical protein